MPAALAGRGPRPRPQGRRRSAGRKGRRLTADDLLALAAAEPGPPVTVLVLEPGELHEDDAAIRLARAVAGANLDVRGPNQSRLDLIAATDGRRQRPGRRSWNGSTGSTRSRCSRSSTARSSSAGDLVASVKVAPHVVDAGIVEAGGPDRRVLGGQPVVWVAPFVPRRVGVVVKESVRGTARERFEASVRAKVEGLGSRIIDIVYVEDDEDAVETALARFTRGADPADLVLTAGSASTDPRDAFFVAIDALGGRVVRRGVPAHPGSMLWLARIGGTSILGLPTCGAYSKATAADLLLPRLLSGEPASETHRREARPRRHPDPRTAVPLPALRAGARRAGRVTMRQADIAESIRGARAYLTANPAEARYRDGAATAVVERGLRVRVDGPDGASVVTDMAKGIGGGGTAPSPGWLFRAAYASCVATLITMRAAETGVNIVGLEVTVDSESDDRGILGIDETVPAGPLSMRVAVRATSADADPARVRAVVEWGTSHCPVDDAVRRAVPVELTVDVG